MKVGDICAFIFYFLLNVMTYGILFMLNDYFYPDYSILYHLSFIIMAIISYSLLITIKNSPGKVYSNEYIAPPISSEDASLERISIPNNVQASQPLFFKQSCDKCNIAETVNIIILNSSLLEVSIALVVDIALENLIITVA